MLRLEGVKPLFYSLIELNLNFYLFIFNFEVLSL